MKRQIHDERIIQEARKQNSLGFTILYFGLLLDLLYRQFILQETISRYWDLALLFFGVTFIMAAKRVSSGLLTNKLNLKRYVPSAIIAAFVFSIVNFLWFGNKSTAELIISGIIFLFGFYGINLLMQYFSSKKNDDMLKDD
jgi:cation transport ATPase